MDKPKILYKYRNWDIDIHKRIIKDSSIYLASRESLNDILESHIPLRVKNVKSLEELVDKYIKRMISNGANPDKIDKKHITEHLSRNYFGYGIDGEIQIPSLNLNTLNYGVFCTSVTPTNPRLWYFYANEHKGFCVGYDTSVLVQFLAQKDIGIIKDVKYYKKIPFIDLEPMQGESLVDFLFYKTKEWKDEEEYRIVSVHKNIEIQLPPNCIKELIFGFNTPQKYIQEMIEAARVINPNILLKKIEVDEFKGKLVAKEYKV